MAAELAPLVGADPEKAKPAALLCKTDLLTEVVGEFPEVQGTMGKYYALAQGEDASVAAAIEEHYKPAGPNDRVPTDPVSIAVALADKIDTLVGFWAIDEKPTGSKDPYALRRAALGVIRIVLDNALRLSLLRIVDDGLRDKPCDGASDSARLLRGSPQGSAARPGRAPRSRRCGAGAARRRQRRPAPDRPPRRGARKIPGTDDGKSLLAGYKRASNILRIEEKKDGAPITAGRIRTSIFSPRSARLPPRSMP